MNNNYDNIISVENLCEAWREFVGGKRKKKDAAEFALDLPQSIYDLHCDLKNKTYAHGAYNVFNISDPKPRIINKATIRDRLLHRAIYRQIYPTVDKAFVFDSFSCRNGKGTHRAMNRFRDFLRLVSKNNTRTCFVLKCDIRKFFASIDHKTLLEILGNHILDRDILWLLEKVIESSYSELRKGLPLGNLTSQLFANIYLNEFDQFVKYKLKVTYYIRYADDFIVLSADRAFLEKLIPPINSFLREQLRLELHPDKVSIKTIASGVDFLGWVHFPDHRVLRTATKRRMFRRIAGAPNDKSVASYLGLLKHGNACKLQKRVCESYS